MFVALWGALEGKKQFMFLGLFLEGCENSYPAYSQYASKLEVAMPQGKALGIQSETREAEIYSHKTSSATWMPQVGKDWKSYLYKHAHDWQHQALPADVKDHLAGCEEMVGKANENKWLSLVEFKSAWLM